MRHIFTAEERARGQACNRYEVRETREAKQMRRECELSLLDKLYAEMAMQEWYPHQ